MERYRLKVELPFLFEGGEYVFDDETGHVYRYFNGKIFDIPLRQGLSGYLWMLRTDSRKYFRKVRQ